MFVGLLKMKRIKMHHCTRGIKQIRPRGNLATNKFRGVADRSTECRVLGRSVSSHSEYNIFHGSIGTEGNGTKKYLSYTLTRHLLVGGQG